MLALLKLIPLKDFVYLGVILAILGAALYERNHLINEGEAKEVVAVTKAGQKAEAAAETTIKTLTDQHATAVATIEDNYEGMLKDADAQHTADTDRLRNFDAYRKTHPVLASAPGSATSTADAGADRFERLESVSAELADALRRDDDALTTCYAERDSLTGK